jgi:hypothetical protein
MVEITLPIILQLIQTAALLVAIVYYITIMRNQQKTRELSLQAQELTLKAQEQALETRQAQLFMQQYNRWQELDWQGYAHLVIGKKLSGYEEFVEKRDNDPLFRKMIGELGGFYEGLGVIVKEGYLSIHLVALMWAGVTRAFWENIAEPIIDDMREQTGFPRGWSETEYVCRELMKYTDEHPELKT